MLFGAAALALIPPARLAAEIRPEAVVAALLSRDDETARETILARRILVEPWGAAQDGLFAAVVGSRGDDLTVGLLREGDPVSVVAGPTSVEALMIEPYWAAQLAIERRHPLTRFPVIAVDVHNGHTTTARSTNTTALHFFLRRGATLLPIFGCMLEARHSEVIGPGNRRLTWTRRYTLEAVGAASGQALPVLQIRDARSRTIVSQHQWRGNAYDPPRFQRLGPFGPG